MLGEYPKDMTKNGKDMISRGRVLPTTSWEHVWNAVGQFMGVEESEMDHVLPLRKNFDYLFDIYDVFDVDRVPSSSPSIISPVVPPSNAPSNNPSPAPITPSPTGQPTRSPSNVSMPFFTLRATYIAYATYLNSHVSHSTLNAAFDHSLQLECRQLLQQWLQLLPIECCIAEYLPNVKALEEMKLLLI